MFSAAVIGTLILSYNTVYLHPKIDGPLWEALESCIAESPLCMVPMLTDAFVGINATGGDVPCLSKLLVYENV